MLVDAGSSRGRSHTVWAQETGKLPKTTIIVWEGTSALSFRLVHGCDERNFVVLLHSRRGETCARFIILEADDRSMGTSKHQASLVVQRL